jgi:hypothetical protein
MLAQLGPMLHLTCVGVEPIMGVSFLSIHNPS